MRSAGLIALMLTFVGAFAGVAAAQAQDETDYADSVISEIRIDGLSRVSEQLVRNQIRSSVGNAFDPAVVQGDIRRLERLGEFRTVDALIQPEPDGSISIIYNLGEESLILEVQVVGNKSLNDQELLGAIRIVRGLPRDRYIIEKSRRDIEAMYREKGYYLTTVTVDESSLADTGVLIFRIIEGPRVKVRAIEFDGNTAFTDKQLQGEIKTRTAVPLFRAGVLDEDVLKADVAAVSRFYVDRGYIDVRVDHQIELSPDNKEAKVIYLIVEGRQFTLAGVEAKTKDGQPLQLLAPEQVAAILEIKPGDVYRRDLVRKSVDELERTYELMGYYSAAADSPFERRIIPAEQRLSEAGQVVLILYVDEGEPTTVGLVRITGNFLTRDKVIRRQVLARPGRPLNLGDLAESQRRIRRTQLFNRVTATVQDPDPETPNVRDVLIEIGERNTGSVNFGVAVGSDSGLFGDFSLTQNNFDIFDPPQSMAELFRGGAFRGAGQRFSLNVRPGNEFFLYSASLTEPHLFESDTSLRLLGAFRERRFDDYDEERSTALVELGRRLGDVWEVALRTKFERVELSDIDADAPTEVFEDAGPDDLSSVGVSLTRTTIGTITRPGRGSRLELEFDHFGAFGGDADFSRVSADYTVFFTLDEDFLGRKSILRLNTAVGYIFDGRAPTYERFYRGGRTFRGFDFREVSPKGIRNDTGGPSDDPVGGHWEFFVGAQYEFPIFQETITGVVFTDTGTVTEDVGFDQYRVSVGAGVRLYIPALGPVPIAFDFAWPILEEEGDDTQVLSFSAEFPF